MLNNFKEVPLREGYYKSREFNLRFLKLLDFRFLFVYIVDSGKVKIFQTKNLKLLFKERGREEDRKVDKTCSSFKSYFS